MCANQLWIGPHPKLLGTRVGMIDCRMGKLPAKTELERLRQLSVITGTGYLRCLCWKSYHLRQLRQMQGAEMDREMPDLELVGLCLALAAACRC